MLKAVDISIGYGSSLILQDACISLRPGQVLGLVAPSGAGKSSLLRIIAGLQRPVSGKMTVDGKDMTGREREFQKQRMVALVLQEGALWPHLTVRENIWLPWSLAGCPVPGEDILLRCERLNISGLLSRYPYQLSGGEKQRVGFVRAAAIAPRYLLLDEPTSALDRVTTGFVRDELLREQDRGAGLIIASHNLSFVYEIAQDVLCIEGKRLRRDQLVVQAVQAAGDLEPMIASAGTW